MKHYLDEPEDWDPISDPVLELCDGIALAALIILGVALALLITWPRP